VDAKGVSLRSLGIRDIALERDDALRAVEFLRNASVPILGGDVYIKRGEKIELTYADWHSDPKPGENADDYLARSWATMESYIKAYPQPSNAATLFALVIGD
jgi:hypothetical protein